VRRLIVNADDFGLTPGVNTAIAELNQAGAVSSATLMASAPSFAAAVHLAFAQTTLAVGCHVVLTDGVPVLPPSEVRSLMDPEDPKAGRFRPIVTDFIRDLVRGRIRQGEIEAEAAAQIRRIQSCGLAVSHLDTHKHLHIFSRVLRPLLRAAQHCGIGAIRNPLEPGWSLRATPGAGGIRRMQVHALRLPGMFFTRSVRQSGLATTDGTIGMLATGSLNQAALRSLLRAMPDGTWELVCHPGYRDEALEKVQTRLRASREVEREALLETIPPLCAREGTLELIDFRRVVQNGSNGLG
jgi:chitin disaccharide deacetylase